MDNHLSYFEKIREDNFKEFSSLFSKLGINKPVTAINIADLILTDRRASKMVSDILNLKSSGEVVNFEGGGFLDSLKNVAENVKDTVSDTVSLVKDKVAENKVVSEEKKILDDKQATNFTKVGIILILFLIVLIIVLKLSQRE